MAAGRSRCPPVPSLSGSCEAASTEAVVDFLLAIVVGEGAERFSSPIVPGVGIDRHEPVGDDPARSADAAESVRRVAGMAAIAAHHDAPIPL